MFYHIIESAGIRHSCFPNSIYRFDNKIVVIRPIGEKEQITLDYSTLFTGSEVLFECSCGHNGCRKLIRGFDFLPVNIQDYYLNQNAVPDHVLVLVRKLKL